MIETDTDFTLFGYLIFHFFNERITSFRYLISKNYQNISLDFRIFFIAISESFKLIIV